ncbi:MAG TPA: zf-TFIIB domain-containing protein [Acidimicrobiia bacterium]|nr:zf-TFIIB domain-containing protein [Acidimicrobiia bacterium]
MKCPTDNTTLQIAERHGIEIDYCPDCRGVWLDRGELDKIIERAGDGPAPTKSFRRGDDDDDDDRHVRTGKKKRSSFLGEIFDFG